MIRALKIAAFTAVYLAAWLAFWQAASVFILWEWSPMGEWEKETRALPLGMGLFVSILVTEIQSAHKELVS